MSFWGMSQIGKDAQGRMNEIPGWYFDQMKNWWGQSNDYLPKAQGLQDEALTEYRRRMGQGFGSVQDLRGIGQEIMPGVDEAIGNRQDRTNRLRGAAQGIPNAGQVRGELDASTDEYGAGITGTYDTAEQDIGGTYGGLKRRADSTELHYLFTLDSYWALDGTVGGSGAQYINHSCDPNVRAVIQKGHINYYSARAIKKGEELLIDYHFDPDVEKVECKCGAKICRGTINLKKESKRKK